jgi:hypothetical protein
MVVGHYQTIYFTEGIRSLYDQAALLIPELLNIPYLKFEFLALHQRDDLPLDLRLVQIKQGPDRGRVTLVQMLGDESVTLPIVPASLFGNIDGKDDAAAALIVAERGYVDF